MAYMFADGTDEEQRLRDQSTVLDPLTAKLFARAGLQAGMKVLDIGSGAGNVAALAADAVGPEGHVVGIDIDPDAVERARRLMTQRSNVEFRVGDIHNLEGVACRFDAVVGRAVLMHLQDPTAALRAVARYVRPGGLVCMHEADMTYLWTSQPTPLWDQVRGGILDGLEGLGVHSRMGLDLFSAFRGAGLPDPDLVLESSAGVGASSPAFGWANIFEAMLPLMKKLNIEAADSISTEQLTERLDAEISALDGIVLGPLMYGAWVTVPEK